MTQPAETHFTRYWRELDARLAAENETPATMSEAMGRWAFHDEITDAVSATICRRIKDGLRLFQKAA